MRKAFNVYLKDITISRCYTWIDNRQIRYLKYLFKDYKYSILFLLLILLKIR